MASSNPFGEESDEGNPFGDPEDADPPVPVAAVSAVDNVRAGGGPGNTAAAAAAAAHNNPFEQTTGVISKSRPAGPRPRKAAAPPPPSTPKQQQVSAVVSAAGAVSASRSEPAPAPLSRASVTPKLSMKMSASIVKSLIPVEESTAQHHELFLQEIEAVDEYWGPTFRGVYEAGQHEVFLERLEDRIKKHDKDIEKMCSHHYQVELSTNRREVYQCQEDVPTSFGIANICKAAHWI